MDSSAPVLGLEAPDFRAQVEAFMAQVPAGQVTTYGDLAALAGHPYAARIVGGMAHYGNPALPWHRLVNRFGGLASGYYGGRETQQQHLEAEGVSCTNFIVDDFASRRWQPFASGLADREGESGMSKKGVQNACLPLLVIVGPTASGKSSLAMQVAQQFDGEIICADSRTVYVGLDIGAAKPSADDRAAVPHWGLDIVRPGDPFTAADFKHYALQKIDEVRRRGHLPILVGGTGLYVDGVIFDYQFGQPDPALREKLENLSLEELHAYCANNNVELPENQKNRRYVMRAIEQKSVNDKRLQSPIAHTLVVGITTKTDKLRARIEARAEQLFESGMVDEAKELGEKYGWQSEAMTGNIYKLTKQFLDGQFDESQLKQKFITADWHLAKRQLTWLKRNPYIHWKTLDEAYEFIKEQVSLAQNSE